MPSYITLEELIERLEYRTRCHISVLLLENRSGKVTLPFYHIIHATAFCDAAKRRPNGRKRCMKCKRLATQKAVDTRRPFCGHCINGVFEYCQPIVENEATVGIVFVGNLATDRDAFGRKNRLSPDDALLDTMEYGMTEDDCRQTAQIVESYVLMLRRLIPDSIKAPAHPTVKMLRDYADENYYDDISLDKLSKFYHFNPKYLGRTFKQHTGQTFREYLCARRLDHALELLNETDRSVIEIAGEVGFSDVSYFDRRFRRRFHKTPTEYRNENKRKILK